MQTAWPRLLSKPALAAWLVLLLALWGMSGPAWGANAAIIDSTESDKRPPGDQAAMRRAVEKSLLGLQFTVLPASDVEIVVSGEPQLKGCYSELCLERIGRLVDSQIIVRYRLKELTPAGFQLYVEIFDDEVGAVGVRQTQDCPGCTGAQAAERLSDMVKTAATENAGRPRSILEVDSLPSGAAVFVDGTELGITPYKRAVFAGKHKVVLSHVGYRSEQQETVLDEKNHPRVEVKLTPGTDPAGGREKTPVYKKWWFWVALGGAVVAASAITAGVVVATRPAAAERSQPANTLVIGF